MFYPASGSKLRSDLNGLFSGIGDEASIPGGPRILAVVSPHAGYAYSGRTAALGFEAARRGGLPRTAVIIGPNHHGAGRPIGVSMEDAATPLGPMMCDKDLASSIGLPIDERAHRSEHSMEVQLPFLQYMEPSIRQVCISMGAQDLSASIEVGRSVAHAVKDRPGDVLLVASSDFTHCGWNYGLPVPRGLTAGQYASGIDAPVIEKLVAFDLEGAFRKRDELGVTACGLGPVAAVVTAARSLGAKNGRLLSYTTSYDVSPSPNAVGYASIVYH